MENQQIAKLNRAYKKYRTVRKKRQKVLDFFRGFMPEMIFRTTRLEGDPVTRKMISSLFASK